MNTETYQRMKPRKHIYICKHPKGAYRPTNCECYLLDQWGNIYDFVYDYDKVAGEGYRYIDLPNGRRYIGKDATSIISQIDRNDNTYRPMWW